MHAHRKPTYCDSALVSALRPGCPARSPSPLGTCRSSCLGRAQRINLLPSRDPLPSQPPAPLTLPPSVQACPPAPGKGTAHPHSKPTSCDSALVSALAPAAPPTHHSPLIQVVQVKRTVFLQQASFLPLPPPLTFPSTSPTYPSPSVQVVHPPQIGRRVLCPHR